jgi:hypothetical protein
MIRAWNHFSPRIRPVRHGRFLPKEQGAERGRHGQGDDERSQHRQHEGNGQRGRKCPCTLEVIRTGTKTSNTATVA